MKRNLAASTLRAVAGLEGALVCFFLLTGAAFARGVHPAATNQGQPEVARALPARAPISALMLSDIHFEPFWDPAKVPQLAAAPVSEWKSILSAPPAPDQQTRFDALQRTCRVRGTDTSFALYQSSLKAMRKDGAGVKFVTASGDFISHNFRCKYNQILLHSTPEEQRKLRDGYRTFVKKSLDFVLGELYGAFPGVPVYVAMGNNDSDCGDYHLDAHGEFLSVTGKEVARGLPAFERAGAEESFAAGGYYSVRLPAPIENTRLLVVNDIFMASNYKTCANKADQTESAEQIAWLRRQLAEARAGKQKVWVMGHIPPGVDLYASVRKMGNLCGTQNPEMFLSSEKLADALAEYGDVIDLAIFAHTHMDELRILNKGGQSLASGKGVAIKMVPSISPVNGNNPSFIVAQIDPSSAALKDYRVIAASNRSGVGATWGEEYDFARSFHKASFSSSSVSELAAGFAADPGEKTQASQNYIRDFFPGGHSLVLQMLWPQYLCALKNDSAQAFKACICSTAK